MWIFLNDAFVSVVRHRERPDCVLARARVAGDLEQVFPRHKAKVERTPGADYLYRVSVHRDTFARALSREALRVDYGNFKDSVREDDRHRAYMDVWSAMYRLQMQREPSLLGDDFPGFDDDEGEDGDACACGQDGGTSCGLSNCLQLGAPDDLAAVDLARLPVVDPMRPRT